MGTRRMLALAALAFLYTTPHIAIGGTFTEFLIGAFILLPVGICFALLAWKTFNRR